MEKVYGPDIISRFNLYTSMKVMVAPASGYTSGQALTALAEVAQENLPTGYTYELGGMAREEAQSSGSATGLIFVLCFVFVFLFVECTVRKLHSSAGCIVIRSVRSVRQLPVCERCKCYR